MSVSLGWVLPTVGWTVIPVVVLEAISWTVCPVQRDLQVRAAERRR